MKSIRNILEEIGTLMVMGALLGFSANQLRKSGDIRLGKNYFEKPPRAESARPAVEPPNGTNGTNHANAAVSPPAKSRLEHPYQVISLEGVSTLFEDTAAADGAYAFVDARPAETFAQGHIPGAVPCYPYESDDCMKNVLPVVENAEKVVVYCGGGDCEDSIFMSRELIETFEVPYDKVFLFEGGWKEWTLNKMNVEFGDSAP
jgi:rhodanese-related sulfurtransferase